MWIVLRVAIALIAFAARWVWPLIRGGSETSFGGRPLYQKIEKNKKGDVTGFRIGMPLEVPFVFRLQRQESSDEWLQKWGFAEEFQTGDFAFDIRVYIACDHPAMHRLLKENEHARERIRAVLDGGYNRISGDGRIVWIERSAHEEPADADLNLLDGLRASLTGISPALRYFADPYNVRFIAVEALTWSLFAYALGAFVEWLYDKSAVHLDRVPLVVAGLVVAVVLFLGLAALIRWFLGKSSRGGRIITEGVVLLALSTPIAGIQLVSDLNRVLDRSEPSVSRWVVTNKYVERARKSGNTYWLVLGSARDGGPSPMEVPGELSVDMDTYYAVSKGQKLEIDIGKGAFGLKWFRRVTPKS